MGRLQVAIDRGGTFTDVVARLPDGRIVTMKLLSEDPEKYPDAPTEAIRRLLQQVIDDDDQGSCFHSFRFDLGSIPIESRTYRLDSNGNNRSDQCSPGKEGRTCCSTSHQRVSRSSAYRQPVTA